MMEPIDDATNITGLSALVNPTKVATNLDLALSETKFIGGRGLTLREEVNAEQEFSRLMDGIYGGKPSPPREARPPPAPLRPAAVATVAAAAAAAPTVTPAEPAWPEDSLDLGDWDAPEPDPQTLGGPPADVPLAEPPIAFAYQTQTPHPRPVAPRPADPRPVDPRPARLRPTRDPVQVGLEAYSGTMVDATDLDREEAEEDKQFMLECIDELLAELATLKVDTSRVRVVNADSSFEEVQHVYTLLQRKYDRARCDLVGTDLIVAGAQLLGSVLDGSRGIGNIRPNLDGWHNTIRPRLRRTRYEISTVTSNVLRQWGVGPMGRLAIELVPSALLYSNMRAGQTSEAYSEDQMAQAYDELRQFD